MNSFCRVAILAAEASRWDNLSSGFRSSFEGRRIEPSDAVLGLLLMAAIVLAAWLLSYIVKLQERHRSYNSPARLFLSLCRAHGLRWRESWWLWRLARSQRLGAPARLFLEPERFAKGNLSPSWQRRADLLLRLRDRLFVEPPQKGKNLEDLQEDKGPCSPGGRPQPEPPRLPRVASPALDVPPWPTANTDMGSPSRT